jgi:serine/threonine protein phosphatase 1
LGDVVDRHPHGIHILRKIMAMPNAKMLLGNHEHMMLRALDQPYDENDKNFPYSTADWLRIWYRNGGKVTHDHLKRIKKTLRMEIVEYLLNLPVNLDVEVNGTMYKLVHAAPLEEYDPEDRYLNPIHFAVWKRFDGDYTFSGDYTLIFGHTPTRYFRENIPMQVWYGSRMIGIDCGSGYPETGVSSEYGRLACLRLDDGKVFYSEEGKRNS